MEYPLIIGGQQRATLRQQQEGLYTVFEAELSGCGGELCRIWLHGGGEQGYLGLMQPWSGGLYLRKKLSRRDMLALPKNIEYASDSEEIGLHNLEKEKPAEQTEAPSCPWPTPVGEDSAELLWLRRTDGSLVSHDGVSGLVALPAELRAPAPGAALRNIEGREYMIFRY